MKYRITFELESESPIGLVRAYFRAHLANTPHGPVDQKKMHVVRVRPVDRSTKRYTNTQFGTSVEVTE